MRVQVFSIGGAKNIAGQFSTVMGPSAKEILPDAPSVSFSETVESLDFKSFYGNDRLHAPPLSLSFGRNGPPFWHGTDLDQLFTADQTGPESGRPGPKKRRFSPHRPAFGRLHRARHLCHHRAHEPFGGRPPGFWPPGRCFGTGRAEGGWR